MKIGGILLRVAIVVFAVGFTAFTFGFWGKFGGALDKYLTMETQPDRPRDTGVVTMTIVQPNQKPSCDKQHPCPKP